MGRTADATETAPTAWVSAIKAQGPRAGTGWCMALTGVDPSLDSGVHGLPGPTGSGKTTLIRCPAMIPRPAEGALEPTGHVAGGIDLRGVRREPGCPRQRFGLRPRITVRKFMPWLKELSETEIPRTVQRAIERVCMDGRADDRVTTLSEAMPRRARIVQALVIDPPGLPLKVVMIATGQLVCHSTPQELAAADADSEIGRSRTDQGHTALLARHHARAGAA
jgi:ABC-2 type transport system ATP-binding protein